MPGPAPRWPWVLLVLLPLAAVGAALVSQHRFEMLPCAWCVLQRLICVAIAVVALPGLLLRHALVRRVSAVEVMLLAAAGLAAALWQHFVAASSGSCGLSLAGRINSAIGLDALWPEVFAEYAVAPMPRASCSACPTRPGAPCCSSPSAGLAAAALRQVRAGR